MPRYSQLGKISSWYLEIEIKNVWLKRSISNDLRVIWNNLFFALRKKIPDLRVDLANVENLFYQKFLKKQTWSMKFMNLIFGYITENIITRLIIYLFTIYHVSTKNKFLRHELRLLEWIAFANK